jgi:predicted DNA binding protein
MGTDVTTRANTSQESTDDHQPPATLVTARLPTEEFALDETLRTVPDLTVTCASLGATGNAAVMPLVWFQTTDETLDAALESDPTVADADELVRTDDRRLYRIEWSPAICSLCQILLSSQAILQNASATERHWSIELLYPTRETLSQTSEYCERYNFSFDIESIRTLDPEQTTQYGLTSAQYEALMLACKRGYFAVPREIDLEGLADEIGVSHQALSERLRRGHQTLINAVFDGPASSAVASASRHSTASDE